MAIKTEAERISFIKRAINNFFNNQSDTSALLAALIAYSEVTGPNGLKDREVAKVLAELLNQPVDLIRSYNLVEEFWK